MKTVIVALVVLFAGFGCMAQEQDDPSSAGAADLVKVPVEFATPDTVCGLPARCAPWACDSVSGVCFANDRLDNVCHAACGTFNSLCPPVDISFCADSCDSQTGQTHGSAWTACYANCGNLVRVSCQLGRID